MDDAGGVQLRREVHAAPLCEPLAAADPAAASAGLDPGRRLARDVGLVRRQELSLRLPLLLGLQARQGRHGRLLEQGTREGDRAEPLPRGLPPAGRGRRQRAGSSRQVRAARRVLLQQDAPRLPGLRRRARLPHARDGEGRPAPADNPVRRAPGQAHLEGPPGAGQHRRRHPEAGHRATGAGHQGPPHRPPHGPEPVRLDPARPRHGQHREDRDDGPPEPPAHLGRRVGRTTGGRSRWPTPRPRDRCSGRTPSA